MSDRTNTFLKHPVSAVEVAAVNANGINTLFANGISTLANGIDALSNGIKTVS